MDEGTTVLNKKVIELSYIHRIHKSMHLCLHYRSRLIQDTKEISFWVFLRFSERSGSGSMILE